MSDNDQTFDLKVVIGHCDLISWFSDFVLYLSQLRNNMWYGMGDAQCISDRSLGKKFEFSPLAFTLLTDIKIGAVNVEI